MVKEKLSCGCFGECDDMGHFWKDVKKDRQEKREDNRQSSADLLREKGIQFEEKNIGAHLIVKHGGKVVDFWPGTGKWNFRGEKHYGRGVFGLLKRLTP